MTITIGFWFIPLIITLLSFGVTALSVRGDSQYVFLGVLVYIPAVIISLIAWLTYFIIV